MSEFISFSLLYIGSSGSLMFFLWKRYESEKRRFIRQTTHRIAIVVYNSTVPPGTGKAVYIEAKAYELTDEQECSHALACLRRRGWEHPPSVDMVVGATLRGVYKAVPEKIWISTEDEHGLDGRVEVDVLEM